MPTRKILLAVTVLILVMSGILIGCGRKLPSNTTLIEPPTSTATTTATTATSGETSWYQDTVNRFKASQPTEIPANLTTGDGIKTGGEFDVNAYFSVLTHLSMEEGYVLDYVYLYGGSAGGPILYVRKANAAPFKVYTEYQAATHQTPRPDNDQSLIWLVKDEANQRAGNKIKADGTIEGYFEYGLLQTLGNQFYLYGKAGVNDKRIVCDSAVLESIFKEAETLKMAKMDNDFKKQARALDLQPVIEIVDFGVTIKFVTFSKWGGFKQVAMLMNKDYPHTMLSYNNEETLLAYDSGLVY